MHAHTQTLVIEGFKNHSTMEMKFIAILHMYEYFYKKYMGMELRGLYKVVWNATIFPQKQNCHKENPITKYSFPN